ncbi:MAG: MBL fold metallo-hydrolase [Candidatus Diapherotrites archaeon]|nr:MBL fold metallo-hydrolase [Candidatus Diapherotrites archaeon]
MKVFEEKGICIEGTHFKVDPSSCEGTKAAVISHAHSDHVNFNQNTEVYCSKETLSLIETNYKKVGKPHAMKFGEKKRFDSFEFSLHNSGHILGSSQVLLEGDQTIAITSDFKMQDSLVAKKAEPLKCDTLVMEATFGLPEFKFSERAQVYDEMAQWCKKEIGKGKMVVLAGYSIGKSQELTAFSNHYLKTAPIVHEKIYENNKVYESHGVKLGEFLKLDHNLSESSVLIMPPSLCNQHLLQALEFSTKKEIASAMATGWKYRNHFDRIFNLSDHSSFDQLLSYVKAAGPKQVLTMHGYSAEFARAIKRKLGIPARPLSSDEATQRCLAEFD